MNDAWGYDPNEDQGNSELNGPKALRDAYKAQGEILKAIQQQLADEKAARQTAELSTVFTNLGVPAAASLYQGEPDPEKAKAWVDTMRATFGSGNVQGEITPAPITPPVIDSDKQAQYEAMIQAGSTGTPMGNMDAAQNAVNSASSIQDLINASMQSQHLR